MKTCMNPYVNYSTYIIHPLSRLNTQFSTLLDEIITKSILSITSVHRILSGCSVVTLAVLQLC